MQLLTFIKYRVALAVSFLIGLQYRLCKVKVGKGVYISLGAHIDTSYPNAIEIGDGAFITRGAMLIAHDHSVYRLKDAPADNGKGYIKIGKNAFIGAGAIILRNVTIGENAVVAAGAVVSKDVPSNTIVGGNPARVMKEFIPR